eukprot:scaffold243770_cov24-Tisochrysis_lutea.AAC.1
MTSFATGLYLVSIMHRGGGIGVTNRKPADTLAGVMESGAELAQARCVPEGGLESICDSHESGVVVL